MTEPISGWRARVEHDFLTDNVTMLLGQRIQDGTFYITSIGGEGFGGYDTQIVGPNQLPPPAVNLRIPEDAARALYDALAQHFAGETGGRQTRADLIHERGRVDKLTNALIAITTGGPANRS